MSDSLRPHESQHVRPPCPSPTPRVHSNSCSSSWWCHPAISSSVIPFSSCPQSLPASGSFPMSQLCAWSGQSTGVSASASFLPKKSRADLLQNGLVGSPCSPRDSQESSPIPQFKSINSLVLSFLHSPTLTSIHDHWKNHSLDTIYLFSSSILSFIWEMSSYIFWDTMYIFVEQILSMETLKTWKIQEKGRKKFYLYYFKIKPLKYFSELFISSSVYIFTRLIQ